MTVDRGHAIIINILLYVRSEGKDSVKNATKYYVEKKYIHMILYILSIIYTWIKRNVSPLAAVGHLDRFYTLITGPG